MMSLSRRFDRRNWNCKTQLSDKIQRAKAQFLNELRLVFSERTLFASRTKCSQHASGGLSDNNTSGQMAGIILVILSF
jgi:hypothetical protein